jgi:hypothetical protein
MLRERARGAHAPRRLTRLSAAVHLAGSGADTLSCIARAAPMQPDLGRRRLSQRRRPSARSELGEAIVRCNADRWADRRDWKVAKAQASCEVVERTKALVGGCELSAPRRATGIHVQILVDERKQVTSVC